MRGNSLANPNWRLQLRREGPAWWRVDLLAALVGERESRRSRTRPAPLRYLGFHGLYSGKGDGQPHGLEWPAGTEAAEIPGGGEICPGMEGERHPPSSVASCRKSGHARRGRGSVPSMTQLDVAPDVHHPTATGSRYISPPSFVLGHGTRPQAVTFWGDPSGCTVTNGLTVFQ